MKLGADLVTDHELKALIRPLLPAIVATARAHLRTEAERAHTATFAADSEDSPLFRPAFTAADVGQFADYFGADSEGRYPFSLHRHFGMTWKQFADATGMLRTHAANEGGKGAWYWTKRPEAKPATFSDSPQVEDFAAYFSEDADGHYHGDMHRLFALDEATFADRSHLVRVEITNAKGHKTHVWKNPNKDAQDAERKTRSDAFKTAHEGRTPREHLEHTKTQAEPRREEARKAYEKAKAAPESLTHEDAQALAEHLDTLTRDELRERAREVEAKLGGLKRELVARLLAKVGAKPDVLPPATEVARSPESGDTAPPPAASPAADTPEEPAVTAPTASPPAAPQPSREEIAAGITAARKAKEAAGKVSEHAPPTEEEIAAASKPAKVDVTGVYDRAGSTAKHSEVNAALKHVAGMSREEAGATLKTMGYPATGDPRRQLAELIADRKGSQLRGLSSGAGRVVDERNRAAYAPLNDEPLLTPDEVLGARPATPPKPANPTAAARPTRPAVAPAQAPQTDAGKAVSGIYDRAASASDADIAEAEQHLAKMPKDELARVGAAMGMAGKVTAKQLLARITERRGTALRTKLVGRTPAGKPKAGKKPAAAPVPEAALAKDPGADKRHLQALAEAAPPGPAREALLDAEYNVPAGDSVQDYTPAERRRVTVERLGAAWRDNHLAGNREGANHLAAAIRQFGAHFHGTEPGEQTPFDPIHYDSTHSVWPGDAARVARKPVVLHYPNGDRHVATKGLVGPV